jgi:hypothetical protein
VQVTLCAVAITAVLLGPAATVVAATGTLLIAVVAVVRLEGVSAAVAPTAESHFRLGDGRPLFPAPDRLGIESELRSAHLSAESLRLAESSQPLQSPGSPLGGRLR